jgi:hypothetical protein
MRCSKPEPRSLPAWRGFRGSALTPPTRHTTGCMRCIQELGILSGHRVERQERGGPGEFAIFEAVSGAEMIKLVITAIERGDLGNVSARLKPDGK